MTTESFFETPNPKILYHVSSSYQPYEFFLGISGPPGPACLKDPEKLQPLELDLISGQNLCRAMSVKITLATQSFQQQCLSLSSLL